MAGALEKATGGMLPPGLLPPEDQSQNEDGINNGLPPLDTTGMADTATLIMELSKNAIESDVYNIKRNAQNQASTIRSQTVSNAISLIGSAVGAGITTYAEGRNSYQLAAAADPTMNQNASGFQMMNWYFGQN